MTTGKKVPVFGGLRDLGAASQKSGSQHTRGESGKNVESRKFRWKTIKIAFGGKSSKIKIKVQIS